MLVWWPVRPPAAASTGWWQLTAVIAATYSVAVCLKSVSAFCRCAGTCASVGTCQLTSAKTSAAQSECILRAGCSVRVLCPSVIHRYECCPSLSAEWTSEWCPTRTPSRTSAVRAWAEPGTGEYPSAVRVESELYPSQTTPVGHSVVHVFVAPAGFAAGGVARM